MLLNYKKNIFIILFFVFSILNLFADSYSIVIENADKMTFSDNIVTLSGGTIISFNVKSDDSSSVDRKLSAEKVIFLLDDKIMQASGNVVLSEGTSKTFLGQSIILNWENLDITVFYGESSSDRQSSSGDNVHFYSTGKKIHYEGKDNVIFYSDGVIATKKENPYWSISAKRLALLNSDLFFENAVIKIGRVPILWVPLFFYTGTTLVFNPSIGLSSNRGMFINTTTEIYGVYPSIGASSNSKKSNESNSTDETDEELTDKLAVSVLSFLRSSETGETIKDGIVYNELTSSKKSELSALESWARNTGSFLAITADIYENSGIALGYDTKNYFFEKKLFLESKAVLAYRNNTESSNSKKIRYAFDFSGSYKTNDLSFSFSLPINSDLLVRENYYNRNTVFGMDSVFGVRQDFPSSYKDESTYSWILNGSLSKKIGKFSFRVESLKSEIKWEWDSNEKKFKIASGQFPYLSFSSSGDFFQIEKKGTTKEVYEGYTNDLAKKFSDENEKIEISNSGSAEDSLTKTLYKAPDVSLIKTKTINGASFSSSYTFKQTVKNTYKNEMEKDDFNTVLSGNVTFNASLPSNILKITEKISVPDFSFNQDENKNVTSSAKIQSLLDVKIPVAGLTYILNVDLFKYTDKNGVKTNENAEWTDKFVTSHSVKFEKSINIFTFSFEQVLKPLSLSFIPGFSFSKNGVTVKGKISLYPENENLLTGSIVNLDFSIVKPFWELRFENKYNFDKEGWEGYNVKQKFLLKFLDNKFIFTENAELINKFEIKKITFELVNNSKHSVLLSFKEGFEPNVLQIKLNPNVSPVYRWKNRIGFQGSAGFSFSYDFTNKSAASLTTSLNFSFAISKILDLALTVSSTNNGFYKYYENDKFSFKLLWEDLLKSFDFFGEGRTQTSFSLNSVKFSLIHYMNDWNFYFDIKANLQKSEITGKPVWTPEISFYIQWNEIPELRVKNHYNGYKEMWEK